MHRGRGLIQGLAGGVALVALSAGIVGAQESDLSLPAQPLAQTLNEISRRTGENVLFTPESVSGLSAPALSGKMSARDAIIRALAGSGLDAVSDGSGGFIIVRAHPRNVRTASEGKAAPAPATTLAPGPAPAPPPPSAAETVLVTGSRIPRTGITSASPVVVVGQAELKYEGTTDVTTLVSNLPADFVDQNSGVSNGASGTANVDLRGLGSKRTLVLVNGARLMPGDIADPVADLNDIPASLVDHVDVLTGGASAVYGSDALAGVVNFIMRKDFEGIELDGTYSISQHVNSDSRWRDQTKIRIDQGAAGFAQSPSTIWNGQTVDSTFILGVNSANDKGNVTGYLGYRSVAAVLEQSRDYSECTIDNGACSGSSNFNQWASFDNLYGGAVFPSGPWAGYPAGFLFECSNGNNVCAGTGRGQYMPYLGVGFQKFNFGASNYLQRPDARYTGGFFAHYQENKELDVYSSFMFADDHTVAQIAPSGLFLAGGHGPSGVVYANCSNPLIGAQENQILCGLLQGDAFVPNPNYPAGGYWDGGGNVLCARCQQYDSTLYIGRRDIEGGDRQDDLRHTSYRMQIGAKGYLGDGWSYDTYGQYGLTIYSENYLNEFSVTRVQNALLVDPNTGKCLTAEQPGGDPLCVPLNLFNGFGSITAPMLNYVSAVGLKEGWTEEGIASGSITGDLGAWGGRSPWAKDPVGISFGAEYRQERLKLVTDNAFATGDLYGQGAQTLSVPTSGFNVTEGFTEVKVPIVQNMPFVEDFSLNGGYRYSSYNITGKTNAWYGAGEWQPVEDIRFRASMQRAVRAPNVLELFAPYTIGGFSTTYPGGDPCATIVTGECALVPNDGTSLLNCPASACNQQVGGNIHLRPETSNTRSIGVVLTPTFFDGFTATVDLWSVAATKYISTLPPDEILNDCYGSAATPDSEAYFCPFVHRNPNGTLYGGGYVASDAINTGYLKTRGVDFEINYQTDTTEWWGSDEGTLALNLVGTWLDELDTEAVPVTPLTSAIASQSAYNCGGLYGTVCGSPAPKWRHKLRLTWSSPFDVQVSIEWRYIGAVALDADTSTPLLGGGPTITQCAGGHFSVAGIGDCLDARISSYSYFDLSAAWDVRDGVELRGGVNNIFDIEPPIISQTALPFPLGNANTITGMYDTLGRTIFVAATVKY